MKENNRSLPSVNALSPYGEHLMALLSPYAQPKIYPARRKLPCLVNDVAVCHLLICGNIAVRRHSDHLLALTLRSPRIIGLAIQDLYIETLQPCRIATLPRDEALRIIEEKQEWQALACHMAFILGKLYRYSCQLSAPSAYKIISHQLEDLMREPEELRRNIAVERYIRERTHLSRSWIMRILSSLKTGGYIVLTEGRLEKIVHLPERY